MRKPDRLQLRKLVGVGNYQFGENAGNILFGSRVTIKCSRKTGRIRHIFRGNRLIATLRPTDGYLALTPDGARILLSKRNWKRNLVVVQQDVSEFIVAGGDVFAKHIVQADPELRPGEEAIIVDEARKFLAVGRAVLSGNDMRYFKRGVAVNVRKGVGASTQSSLE